jgi:hypothetical protein
MTTNAANLTPASRDLFERFAKDAPNWSGMPPVNGNFNLSKADRGNLTDLQTKGLIKLKWDPEQRMHWVDFTEAGQALASEIGIDLE